MLLAPDTFRRLCQARQMLGKPGSAPIRQISRQAGMSHHHFIRQFEVLFGLTPHQYRIAARLERAKQLLAAGGQSVTEVCMEVGMSSLGSFSDQFTRRVGASPSSYQRQHDPVPGCFNLMGSIPVDAFRNFREAPEAAVALECEDYANQTNQPDGR